MDVLGFDYNKNMFKVEEGMKYHDNDTFEFGTTDSPYSTGGVLVPAITLKTDSALVLKFNLFVPKILEYISTITLNDIEFVAYGNDGLIIGTVYFTDLSGQLMWKSSANSIGFQISLPTTYSGATKPISEIASSTPLNILITKIDVTLEE